MPPDADFDLTDPCSPPPRYNVLHDPHLKEYYQKAAMRKRLIEKGFITPSGYVKCTLLEFNMFRQWIRKLKLDRIYQERRRQREIEIQQWKEKQAHEQLLRDEELYNIVREREQKARELKERGIKRRDADRRKYLKLQEQDRKRREKFNEATKRNKDINEHQREKNLAEKQAQRLEEEEKVRKFKFRLLVKRTSEDKQRESMLQKRRQTLLEEKEKKLKETWKRRCSLSLAREEEKSRREETEREEHIKNVGRRAVIVAQQRRKSRAYYDKCLQRRRNALEKQHQEAENFLEKIRDKKMKDLELWKQKHRRMRERHLQQKRRGSLQNKSSDLGPKHRRRSSAWDLLSSLKKEFGIDDNVLYSGVVFAGRKPAAHGPRQSVQLAALTEEDIFRQVEERDQFERLLSRLEAEFALRERVHYIVFGIISNAQDMLDIQERLEIGKEVPGYVQRIVDASQRILYSEQTSDTDVRNRVMKYVLRVINNAAASVYGPGELPLVDEQTRRASQDIATIAVTKAKEEFQRRASLAKDIVTTAINSASQKALAYGLDIAANKDTFAVAEDISENLCECAKDIITAAMVSALHYNKDDREVVVARSLAADAVQAAKASLERLYGIQFELIVKEQVDTKEMSTSLDKCAKEMVAAAIISATRSLERAIRKDDPNATAARSLALDAVTAAKASLEELPGVIVELEDEKQYPFTEISTCLIKSARDAAQAVVTSSTLLRETTTEKNILENRAAQSLASDAVQAAVASIEKLYGIKVDPEDESQKTAKTIAAAAVISATGSVGKELKRSDVDLAVAARELASSALDTVKASFNCVHSGKVVPGSKQDARMFFSSLEEAAKEIAAVAVDSATRSLEHIAEKNEWDLAFTTRELVVNVLDSAKAPLERLYGIKIDPEVELLPSPQETSIISSSGDSLESILGVKGHEEELMVAARNLASDAIKSAKTSLERLYCIANKMENNIKNTALDISKSLVDSSRNLLQHLEKEGFTIAGRELACSAIESAAKSISKPYEDEISVQDIVSSDSRLLKAAAKVSAISARASVGELFDRGFIGGVELEEATRYLATHALISAEAMLQKVQDSSATADLDLEICKAAFELAFHAVLSAEGSVARLEQENQPGPSEPGSDHGTLFWKVTTYVEGLINGALRRIGSAKYYNDINDDLEEYEVISHDQACKADAEYGSHIQDLYQREILALKASRIVNDVLEKAIDIAKARGIYNSFFSVPDVRPGNVGFVRRRSSSVHFNEGTTLHSRRDSYVPCETDFLSAANRPPTPRFRKNRAESVVLQEIRDLEKELAVPSDNDLNTLNVSDSDLVQRRLSDPGPGINSQDASLSEPERSASDSKITIEDQETTLTEKASLYELIKKREGTASCEISPWGSYVVLPHLNPSECSLIAARVESYEVLWNQKKTTTSVTSLPSLSPRGSFVASEAVEQVLQRKESQSSTVPSSSRLPDITSSTSKISKGSTSASLLKQSPEHPAKRTSSQQLKKSSPKPSPKTSKESAKLPSKPSEEKGYLGKATASSRTSNILSPLTRASLSPRASIEKPTLSKATSSQKQLKSSPKTSVLFARVDPYTTISPSGPSSDKTVKSPRVSADKMSLTSRTSTEKANLSPRVSKGNVMSSPCVSRERVVLSPTTSTANVTPSPRASTEKATLLSRVAKGAVTSRSSTENAVLSPSKGKITQSPRASTENVGLSPNVFKGKVTPSPRASAENAVLSPSKNKVTQSPRASTENAVLSPRVSKDKVTHSPRASTENAVLFPRVSKGKVTQSPRTSTENVALSPRVSKGKVTQSPRISTQEIAVSSHSSIEKVLISSRVSSEKTTASSRCTVNVASEVGNKDNKASSQSIEVEKKTTKLEKAGDLKVDQSQGNEIAGKSLASVESASPKTDVFQQQGVGSKLDRHDVYSDRTGGVSDETKQSEINKNLKSVVPSLERIILDKRLTPEGAEAETRLASSVDVIVSTKCAHPEGLKQARSDSVKPSLSKSLSSAAESAVGGTISGPGSSSSSQEVPLSKASVRDEVVTPRKKLEGEDRSEEQGVTAGVEIDSPERKEEKKESVGKMLDSSTPEITQVPDANQQLVPSPRDVKEVRGYPTYRKVSISRSIHDTVDDIVQRMLSTADEPSAVEVSRPSCRGSREAMKRDSKMNFDAPRTFGRERRLPTSKVSKTVIDTVDFMLQSVSASDERRPRQSSGRTFSRSDVLDGREVPRTASSLERFCRSTSSAHQGISCVYGLSPSPPKLPSPKRSRLRATTSQDSLGIRATQSDSSIVSSSSDKAADLKPKVSGAWLDDDVVGGGDASVRSQSPKRPHSSPSPSLHRRSSGKLSMRHSLEGVSMETDSALGNAS